MAVPAEEPVGPLDRAVLQLLNAPGAAERRKGDAAEVRRSERLHGEPQIGDSLRWQITPAGYGTGVPIPNFNDNAAAPDMGAHQSGTPAMTFGVNGHR